MTENFCGVCEANGLKRQLVLFQMNLEEAILLCENKECVFPLGVTDNDKLIVSRKASEVSSFVNLKRKRKKKTKQRETEEPENVSPESTRLEIFLQWKNVDSLCWLHSLLSLLVNNVTLATSVKIQTQNVDSLLRTLTESFNKAQELSSTNREQAENDLQDVRDEVWKYLQPKMKCERGVNDSPVTAFPLLLRENGTVSEKMLQVYQWEFTCSACGYQQIDKRKKHLVTFPNVVRDFSLHDPTFTRPCYRCGAPEQTSRLVYDRMPDCIFLHFEEGLKSETFQELEFQGENGCYILTQFIQYKRNPDHFVCWTRESKGKRWMELDDLKSPVCSWSSSSLDVPPSEVHIAVWEKVSATVLHSLPSSVTKEINTTELKTSFNEKLVEDVKMAKSPSMPLLNIDCNTNITSSGDTNKGIISPPLRSPMFSPLRGRTPSLVLPQKTRAGQFEPYIPRKKRLVSQSCPNSPLCENDGKTDSDRSASPLSSPMLSQPFLTWQDIKEQNKKLGVDYLQSDSGYSSPASVSSCSSLLATQSNLSTSINDHLEELHEHGDAKQSVGGQTHHLHVREDSLNCNDSKLFSKVYSSCQTNAELVHEVGSLDLADKLEQLLPDCLLENPRDSVMSGNTNVMETKLDDFGKLSAEQDQFILNLLAA